MKIAIDCADLDHRRIDGTRVYIKNLLDHFGKIDSKNDFFLYHQKNFNPMLAPEQFPNYIDKKTPYRFWWTQTRLAFELKKDKPDILWMPIQQLPYLVKKDRFKKIVTVHDLAFKIFPKNFNPNDRFKLNLFTNYAIKNADRIIAVSHSTKEDILRFYPKINPDKIKVVYHGVSTVRNSIPSVRNKIKNFRSKFKIGNSRYILYLGAIQPRKDLKTLVEAFEILKTKNFHLPEEMNNDFRDLKLVIAGAPAWQAEKTLEKIKNSKYSRDIILTGQVSFEEMAELYEKAEIFILPSLYEGFGMPILEAWSAGVPVIVADNSSLREIGGKAVEKFQTGQTADLADKLNLLLGNENRRMGLIEKGRQRLKNFSWEKCAKETLGIFEDCLAASGQFFC